MLIFIIAALLLCGGCSTFERDWQAWAGDLVATNRITGRWQGTWRSDKSGHDGKLRCIITAQPDGTYRARYHATYAQVLTFEYTVPLKFAGDQDTRQLTGKANLGFMAGGVYKYEASVTGNTFHATYRCKYDHGEFNMTRVDTAGQLDHRPRLLQRTECAKKSPAFAGQWAR